MEAEYQILFPYQHNVKTSKKYTNSLTWVFTSGRQMAGIGQNVIKEEGIV